MKTRLNMLCAVAGCCAATGFVHAQDLASVTRVLHGLAATDTLNGGLVIGLRGDKPGGTNFNNAMYARIGYAEGGSDDRRTTGGMNPQAAQNGFNQNLAAFGGNFIQTRDFSLDGNPAPGVFSAGTNHATHAAGITLSRDATHQGLARDGVGYMALFDDYKTYVGLNTAADYTNLRAAYNYLGTVAPQVDVINSSWGFRWKSDGGNAPVVQADLTGNSYAAKLLDYYTWFNDILTVKSAGNTGNGAGNGQLAYTIGLVTNPGDGYNGITVGATDPASGRVASFSAYLPLANGRNGVQVVAPGVGIQSVGFNGTFPNSNGTSFAAPHVTGAIADLVSAAKQANAQGGRTDKGDTFRTDPRVLKAIIVNSATHSTPSRVGAGGPDAAWAPGQVDAADNRNWVHPLNYVNGAGELDVNEAWREFREEGPKLLNAGTANQFYENRFWDFNIVTQAADRSGQVNYLTTGATQFTLPTGFWINNITATVTWDRHVFNADLANGDAISMTDIDLWFQYSTDNGASWQKILASRSPNDSLEHIYLQNIADAAGRNALYRLQVWVAPGFFGTGLTTEGYGLAVRYTAIPTPGGGLLAVLGLACVVRRRRV